MTNPHYSTYALILSLCQDVWNRPTAILRSICSTSIFYSFHSHFGTSNTYIVTIVRGKVAIFLGPFILIRSLS